MTKPDTIPGTGAMLDDLRALKERIEALPKVARSITLHPDDMSALLRAVPAALGGWWLAPGVPLFSDASVVAPGNMVVRWSDGSVTVEDVGTGRFA